MPGLPEAQYYQLILNERFGKIVALYSAGADMGDHSIEDVESILDNIDRIANGFRTLRDVSDYFIRFHEKEGRFYDPGDIINEVDNICSQHT